MLALRPDGVFLSNGPGDPARCGTRSTRSRELLGEVPVFGICLGHQLLSRAHRRRRRSSCRSATTAATIRCATRPTGHVEITSQNHNFCVDPDSLGGDVEVTHLNLNDLTNEGMRVRGVPAFSVQYHPEAGPGSARQPVPVRDVRGDDGRPGGWRPAAVGVRPIDGIRRAADRAELGVA